MAQSRTRSRRVTRSLIKAVAVGVGVGTVIMAPNATLLIDRVMKKHDRERAKKSLANLQYRKLVEVRQKGEQKEYRLTKKGWGVYEAIQIDELTIATPRKWDKKWRMVLFDIPLTKQGDRQVLLHKLRDLNFYMLQKSVWLHPFDCEKQVGVLVEYLKLQNYVSFILVENGNFTDKAEFHFKKAKLLI